MNKKHSIDFKIKACWHTIARMYNHAGLEHEVSISMGFVLLNLSKEVGIPSTHIAPLLGMEAGSLTRLIKSMEENGLICKVADEHDRRQVNIFLTELGVEKRKIAAKTVKEFNSKIKQEINEEELKIFEKVLHQIIDLTELNIRKSDEKQKD